MSNLDIIRAWKDEEYRNSLSDEQRAQLPENPAGMIELSDEDMGAISGGFAASRSVSRQGGCSCSCGGNCCSKPQIQNIAALL
ncbi:hypothetical protein MC7420_5471 [Coleofasciculus chthonoplastes PCC 7420]|uniref:Mersacidin/lichenicidin family type 2 lantibiotic n=1 Tax=Coleofasciculus chthonoplastes PCC 7420 TaxID=118168 RepID=B4VPV5_9CYAN|nr:mersacidin/lichenicidin family type 2 lantibiotic [Coleofasciculus chthonoplastes]EDX76037.1 hypothetical protein MC7420_5471 [Coleofasciculus chthonoplastes PCC 7420]